MRATLERMARQSIRAAQNVEYRAECLRQERARLHELAMQAFCKVGYSLDDGAGLVPLHRGPVGGRFHTLLHGGAADAQEPADALVKVTQLSGVGAAAAAPATVEVAE